MCVYHIYIILEQVERRDTATVAFISTWLYRFCNVACNKMPLEINTGGWGYYIGAYALYSARKSLSQWGNILQRLRCLQWSYFSLVEFVANHESIFLTIYRNIYITFARFEYFVTSFRTIGIINIFSWNSNSQMYGYLHCCKPKEHFHNG